MYEDVITRERVFVNSRGFEFFRLPPPKGYNPLMWRNRILHIESDAGIKEKRRSSALTSSALFSWVFDPAHTAVEVTLVPRIFYADYLKANPPLPVLMPMRGKSGSSDEVVSISSGSNSVVSLSVVWPLDGGNRAEIFRSGNLMDSNDWEVVVNAIPATGGVSLVWSDPNSTNRTTAFYVVSDATIDADHDGFSDARERLITHTPTNQFNFVDSDNDGLHDWYEISFFGDLSESGTNDFDGDGLLNTQEWVLTSTSVEIICDPMNVDTDGDGTDDGVEYNQGSDPSDPGDEGNPPPPVTNTTTKVTMSIQGFYGEDSSVTLWLKSGTNSYSVSSIGHNVSSNTFDVVQGLRYTASLSFNGYTAGYRASIRGNGIIITDENSMLEDHELECCVDTNLTAAVDVIKVQLKSINFSGTNNHVLSKKNENWKDDMFADDGNISITYPEWQDTNKDRIPDKNEPVCYTKGSKPEMAVVLSISPTISTNLSVKIRLKKGDAVLMTTNNISITGSEVSIANLAWSSTLEDAVQNKDYVLDWEYSLDGGTTYTSLGTSVTKFFLTDGTPSGPTVMVKRLDWCLEKVSGEKKLDNIILSLHSYINTNSPPVFLVSTNEWPPGTPPIWSMLDPKFKGGSCIAHSNLLKHILNLIGVSGGKLVRIHASTDLNFNKKEHHIINGRACTVVVLVKNTFNHYEGCLNINSNYYPGVYGTKKFKSKEDIHNSYAAWPNKLIYITEDGGAIRYMDKNYTQYISPVSISKENCIPLPKK
jgi:hypothetical protein